MKRIISILLTITMLLSITVSVPLSVSAITTDIVESGATYTDQYGKWSYSLTADGNGYKITGYDKSMTEIEIPSSINGLPVLEIGDYVFSSFRTLSKVTIPDSVITIGDYAFRYCEALTEITIPTSVTTIGYDVFSNCVSLTNIEVAIDNNSYSAIDGVLFNKAQSKLICYPCGKEASSYIVPDSVTVIGNHAFASCKALTNITVPNSVTTIEKFSFYACANLVNVTIPDSITAINDYTFFCCYALDDITIPDSVTSIGYRAFDLCRGLTDITIPNSVTSIGELAFKDCNKLTEITIPASVTTMGDAVFNSCDNLTKIDVAADNNNYTSVDGVLFNKAKSKLIGYPSHKTSENYSIPDSVITIANSAFEECNTLTSITIPSSVTTIGDSAFKWCNKLTNITIPNSVTAIGNKAFYYCSKLTDITLPNSITTINESTFSSSGLTSITIPSSVTTIGDAAFSGCNLASVTIPSNVKTIGFAAFSGCLNLTDITLPSSITTIDSNMFNHCEKLTNITIPSSVTTIRDWAFSSCRNLTDIAIPNSVTTIEDNAFYDCVSLADVYYTGKAEEWSNILIGNNGNDYLKNATIHYESNGIIDDDIITDGIYKDQYGKWMYEPTYYNGNGYCIIGYEGNVSDIEVPSSINGIPVVAIADRAFAWCYSLTSIAIPYSVAYISNYAFDYCDPLTNIEVAFNNEYYTSLDGVLFDYNQSRLIRYPAGKLEQRYTVPDSVRTIDYNAFFGCTSLTNITIPTNVTTIENNAFEDCSSLCDVYYLGNRSEWNSISIGEYGNSYFLNAIVHYNYGEVISGDINSGVYKDKYGEWRYSLIDGCEGYQITDYFGIEMDVEIPSSINGLPVLEIDEFAFYYSNLTSVIIPNSVTTIGEYAFYRCMDLNDITIPTTVTNISEFAFDCCFSLSNVYYMGNESEWNSISLEDNGNGNSYLTNATIHYNYGKIIEGDTNSGIYKDRYGAWNYELINSGEGYRITGYDNSMSEIEIPSSINSLPVLEIGESAFYYSNLTSVIISDNVTTIKDYAFECCFDLTDIVIPSSVTSIGDEAFKHCFALTSIAIPSSVTAIGEGVFEGSYNLTSIDVSSDNTSYSSIDGVLFDKELSKLICYPAGKTADTYTVPNSVTVIGKNAFNSCYSLTNVKLPDSVTAIDGYAFYRCDKLTEIIIPKNVTTIGRYAFHDCWRATNVIIPKSVTFIDVGAFGSCSTLTDVYYTGSESEWNSITICSYDNKELQNATIHYNYVPPIAGDISGDGALAVNDVIYLLKNIVGDIELTDEQLANADVSGDGALTILDAILIQRLILEMV